MFSPFIVEVDDDDLPYALQLTAEVEDGQLLLGELILRRRPGGPGVTGEGIRAVPVASILRQVAPMAAMGAVEPGTWTPLRSEDEVRAFMRAYRASPRKAGDPPSRRSTHRKPDLSDAAPAQRLGEVADTYRAALAAGSSAPSKVIAARFRVTPGYARRLVQRARAEGLLGGTVQGKARP
jgi:hypothetical protein